MKNGSIHENGTIKLISAKKIDNGVCGYVVEDKKFKKLKNVFTIATQGNGGAGYSFYHPYEIYTTSMIISFKLKNNYVKIFNDDNKLCLLSLILT